MCICIHHNKLFDLVVELLLFCVTVNILDGREVGQQFQKFSSMNAFIANVLTTTPCQGPTKKLILRQSNVLDIF